MLLLRWASTLFPRLIKSLQSFRVRGGIRGLISVCCSRLAFNVSKGLMFILICLVHFRCHTYLLLRINQTLSHVSPLSIIYSPQLPPGFTSFLLFCATPQQTPISLALAHDLPYCVQVGSSSLTFTRISFVSLLQPTVAAWLHIFFFFLFFSFFFFFFVATRQHTPISLTLSHDLSYGVQVGSRIIDFETLVQSFFGRVVRGCMAMSQACYLSRPCLHGTCRNTMSGYYCDCSRTAHRDERCQLGRRVSCYI